MSKKIKWGIIGLGKIAHKFAGDLLLSDDAELLAVASRSKDKAKSFANKYKADKYYDSYENLMKDADVDIVYIATPHVFHFDNAVFCLNHGKHVLCEKPLAMNEKEVRLLMDLANSKQLFLMEGLWTRFIPSFEKVLSLLKENTIGDLLFVNADFGFKAPVDLQGRLFNKDLGGGTLLDIGIYPIYLSLMTLGVPDNIKSTATLNEEGIDTYCAMLFEYKNSSKAKLESTFQAETPTEAHIYGTKGKITMHYRFHHSEKISLELNDEEHEEFNLKYTGEGYLHEINEVNQCLLDKKIESLKHPLSSSLELIQTMDRVRKQIGLKYKAD